MYWTTTMGLDILFQNIIYEKPFIVIIIRFLLEVKKWVQERFICKIHSEMVKSGIWILFCLKRKSVFNHFGMVFQKAGTQQVVTLTECRAFDKWYLLLKNWLNYEE